MVSLRQENCYSAHGKHCAGKRERERERERERGKKRDRVNYTIVSALDLQVKHGELKIEQRDSPWSLVWSLPMNSVTRRQVHENSKGQANAGRKERELPWIQSLCLPASPLHKDSFCGSSYGIACNGSVNDTGEDAAKYSVK